MAQKRMFDKSIIENDYFMDLPMGSKALYFLLGMEADDEGFVSPKRVLKLYGGSDDDIKVLISKNFIIPFESGVVVITDWKINNWLDKRRIKETRYQLEKATLNIENGRYIQGAKQVLSKCLESIEENSIEENSIEEYSIEYIVGHLNDKTGSNFKSSSRKTRKLIKTRIEEGFKQQDFITVIDTMVTHWLNDEKMCVYLRPETLFSNKFEGYLNRKQKKMTTNDLKIELGGLLDE